MDENEWGRVSITDIHAVIDLPVRVLWERYGTPEYWARIEKELKREAADLEDFIRDHRSRDGYGIDIVKTKYEKAHQIRQEKE